MQFSGVDLSEHRPRRERIKGFLALRWLGTACYVFMHVAQPISRHSSVLK